MAKNPSNSPSAVDVAKPSSEPGIGQIPATDSGTVISEASPQSAPLIGIGDPLQPVTSEPAAIITETVQPVPGAPAAGETIGSDPMVMSQPLDARPLDAVEEVRASKDSLGVTRSAEVVGTNLSLAELRRRQGHAAVAATAREVPGKAKRRVLASGVIVPAHIANEDRGEERIFTTASRIMKSATVYDIGAPVPLTRAEFLEKAASRAIEEARFEDGEEAPELADL